MVIGPKKEEKISTLLNLKHNEIKNLFEIFINF